MTQEKGKYFLAIDAMRVLAIVAVVCIHASTRILEVSTINSTSSLLAFLINQVSRFAVPLFFMISGFVLEVSKSSEHGFGSYLSKRLSRIFLPYVFWSGVYYFFIYTQHNISFFSSLLTGSASYQLYFIPTVLIFYLTYPLIHNLYRIITTRRMLIWLGLIEVILLGEGYYYRPLPIFFPIAIVLLNYYVFLLGMVAAHNYERLLEFTRKWKSKLILAMSMLALFVFVEGRTLFLKTGNYLFYYSQWRPSVLIYTLLVFAVVYFLFEGKSKYEAFIGTFSRLSFFIFFVHVIVLEVLWTSFFKTIFQNTINLPGQQFWFDPLYTISILAISYGIAYLVHKIPLVSRITG
jgi:surface polysaccharide O-acyltransferase-like enzyme